MPLARTGLRCAALACDRLKPPPAGVVILAYHRVGADTQSAVDVDVHSFTRQLEILRDRYEVISLDAALDVLATGNGARQNSVVLTFDDGTHDFVETAAPLLEAFGLPATLYLATAFVDAQQPFPWGARPLSWTALADACSSGLIEVGSHTHRHLLVDREERGVVADDLDRSIELIAANVGRAPKHFAYPKAIDANELTRAAVVERFSSAALAGNRVNRIGFSDAYRLWRTPVERFDTDEIFIRKASGGLRLEGALRAALAGRRYRTRRE